MKPVSVTGMFEHAEEMKIDKEYRGEKGVQIITPFYTHIGPDGQPHAILVNRGWVPEDMKDLRKHYRTNVSGTIRGVLYRGDTGTKYEKPNSAELEAYSTVKPAECAMMMQLHNEEEASKMMLHIVDFEPDRRQLLPSVPSTEDLTQFKIAPERHQAYEFIWRSAAFAGILANTALWLYL